MPYAFSWGGVFCLCKQAFYHISTYTHAPASLVWLWALHCISTDHHNGRACVIVQLCIILALLITMEAYVCTNCTPSCSHSSTCLLGHIYRFPSRVNTPMLFEGLYSKSKYDPSFQTATPLLAHTYAHRQSHTFASSLKLLSTRLNDVVCYIDTPWCLSFFCYLWIGEIKDSSTILAQKSGSVPTYCLTTVTVYNSVWVKSHCTKQTYWKGTGPFLLYLRPKI